jgi:hypothetical protein
MTTLLEACVEEMVIVPLYVPVPKLPGLTETLTLPGVVPPPPAESQFPPLGVCTDAAAVKVTAPPLEVTLTFCAGGLVPPDWKAKLNEDVGEASVGAAVTCNDTGTLIEGLAAPGTEMLIEPL